jgi:hypothetical protein
MNEIELDRIVTLQRAAELMGVHVDTVRRHYRDKFIWISPARCGLRLRDVQLKPSKRPVSQPAKQGATDESN